MDHTQVTHSKKVGRHISVSGPMSSITLLKEDPIPYKPYPDSIQLNEDYFPCVLHDSESFSGHGSSHKYKMWHQGIDMNITPPKDQSALAVSVSDDGIHWTL